MNKSIFLTELSVPFDISIRGLNIKDSYDWHQRVWEVFPNRNGQQREFLYRVHCKPDRHQILIVSPYEAHRPDWCPEDGFRSKPIPDSFFNRVCFRFSLLANPTRREAGHGAGRGRIPLAKRDELVAWLQRKADAGGFLIDPEQIQTVPCGRQYFIRSGQAGLHSAVEFSGVLKVADPVLFRKTFQQGFGSAKAFGFGLLALHPIN